MMDINSILRDRKKVWSIASSLILCALAFGLLFRYDYGNLCKIKQVIAERRDNKSMLDSLDGYKKYLKEFNAYLASDKGIDWLMGILTAISKDSGVILSAVKPLETEHSSGYGIVKVSAEGKSSYEGLLRFIESIEDSKDYIFIESISMRSIETGADNQGKNTPEILKKSFPGDMFIGFKVIIASVVREI